MKKKKAKAKAKPKEKTIVIWTRAYNPFILGGDVHAPMGCKIKVDDEPISLGKGYKGYVIWAPDATKVIAESTTGAIVGSTVYQVQKDIESGNTKVIRAQMVQARQEAKRVVVISEDKFWKMMGK